MSAAARGAGFADAAHLTRTSHRMFGFPPSAIQMLGPLPAGPRAGAASVIAPGQHQLGDRPLAVLTAAAPLSPAALAGLKLTAAQGRQRDAIWRALQADRATWSSRSQHRLVPDASHYIQLDRPDVVIASVRSVVDGVRQGPDGR